MAYVYAVCTGHVTVFSTGGEFQPVCNFTELYALTQAAHSYVLLFPSYTLRLSLVCFDNVVNRIPYNC